MISFLNLTSVYLTNFSQTNDIYCVFIILELFDEFFYIVLLLYFHKFFCGLLF